ncbi:C-terminal processing peptidase-2, Serine peptidase, MEROPS family S41A [Trichormus variabilis ATCC 29413]|uniref:Carboxyl-terminal-processing protease n=2 Tax=Anabaena variabilis TaxID=264691 RepID=Q3MG28_TRIV2|nr:MULTISPECIES: carboxyl-terminal processing protease CtpC [Nostocaceae]ABA20058.1 C-terminal processing peptidase-2, Serine peptidase, MEROPS family S41A [Trichormus variabilis ATCC 29413]MBC1215940.1 S41 family peptidase [Trichormus variabilis ARAD]MBC1255014.1 S41 family peptidase [Trichormus variabilis V5]MBC1266980.1 S41 family peptidase [Trichormus variabilis FSR]MBC1303918.1 S41 family peptidase [Trichormus variabilis N2B]
MVITKSRLVLGATAVTLSTIAVTSLGIHSRGQALFKASPKELVDEVWQIVQRQYVDGTFNQVDWQAVRKEYLNKSYSNQQEAYKSIREMLKRLNDPYTRFMDPQEFKNMQVDTSGELTGIGITISQDEKTKQLVVIAPIEDTPAFKAGILAKDVILKIDGKSTKGMDTNQAVNLIRGTAGSQVTLTIQRSNQEKQFKITRARIEIHPVRYSQKPTSVGKVGYIRLNQFSANAGKEMQEAIKNLEKQQVAGYILDLRGNPGGLLFSSVEIARMWMDKGTIVSTVDRQGEREREVANGRALTNKPLVILVDKGSASASEILSGALQDNKRAVIVGTQTFGKGLVQSVRPLDDGSGLAVTIAKYLTPNDRDINKHGIDPDVKVELTDAQRQDLWLREREKLGTLDDLQFAKAVEILGKQIAAKGTPTAEKK